MIFFFLIYWYDVDVMSGPLRRGGNAHSTSHPQLPPPSLPFLYFFFLPRHHRNKIKKEEEEEGITCVRVVHVTWKRGLGSREEEKKKKMGVSMEKKKKPPKEE